MSLSFSKLSLKSLDANPPSMYCLTQTLFKSDTKSDAILQPVVAFNLDGSTVNVFGLNGNAGLKSRDFGS